MTDDIITDLKQFITTTVGQQISDVQQQIGRLDIKLTAEIRGVMSMVGEALSDSNDAGDGKIKDHERRINRIEKKLAA